MKDNLNCSKNKIFLNLQKKIEKVESLYLWNFNLLKPNSKASTKGIMNGKKIKSIKIHFC